MSYTIAYASAHCTIDNFKDARSLALSIYDFLVNHPDEIPEAWEDYDLDDCVFAIESYLQLDGDALNISYSTEADGNFNPEAFDFLSSHIAHLQSSPFMVVEWTVDDSREGVTSGSEYLDKNGESIDIHKAISDYILRNK